MIAEHYRVFLARAQQTDEETRRALYASFMAEPAEKREGLVLYWPLSTSATAAAASSPPPSFSLVPLRRVSPDAYAEYVYFAFVHRLLERTVKRQERERRQRRRLVKPARHSFVRVRSRTDALPPELCVTTRLAPPPTIAQEEYQHWPRQHISPYRHKSYFAVRAPRLELQRATRSRLMLYAGERWQLVASNCRIVIGSVERFNGITVHIPGGGGGGGDALEFDLSQWPCDSEGQRALDLAQLSAPDQLCLVETHGSQVALVFDERPGSVRLCARSTDHCTCGLDLAYGELEYWSAVSTRFPVRYHVVDAELLTRLAMEVEGADADEDLTAPPSLTLPRWCRGDRAGFSEAMDVYQLLRAVRVDWTTQSVVPYFFLGDTQLVVQLRDGHYSLLWENRTVATVLLHSPEWPHYDIVFHMVLGDGAPHFDMAYQYIY